MIIAVRRNEALAPAWDMAKLVFDMGSEDFREAILDHVLQGLDYLASELDYEREHDDADQVPLLRLRCACLAVSMAEMLMHLCPDALVSPTGESFVDAVPGQVYGRTVWSTSG